MRNFILSAILVIAAMSSTITASAEQQAAAPTSSRLYKGLTMKAEQRCPRFPGEGVTFTLETLNESGTGGNVSVQVSCWGSWAILDRGRYFGSITTEGSVLKLRFLSWTAQYGADLEGTWQTDQNGRPMLVFGKSMLRTDDRRYTDELVFR